MRRAIAFTLVSVAAWVGCHSVPEAQTPAPIVLGNGDEGDDEDGLDGVDGAEGTAPSSGATTPIPTKIRYVLVLVKENHTFDNYFTGFPGAESSPTATLSNGTKITRKKAPTELMKDICHSNACGQAA